MPRLKPGQIPSWHQELDRNVAALGGRAPRVIIRVIDWVFLFLRNLETCGYQPITVKGYFYFLRGFARWCEETGRRLVRHLRRDDIIAFLQYLIDHRHASRHTIRFQRQKLAVFFCFLSGQGLHRRRNPATGIGFYGRDRRPLRDVLTHDEAVALVHAPQCTLDPILAQGRLPSRWERLRAARDSAILALMVGSGLRRTEISELSLDGLDLDHGLLRVCGKGRQQLLRTDRDAFLHPLAIRFLRDYLLLTGPRSTGPLFLCLDGSPIAPHTVGHLPVYYGRLSLQRQVTAHLLRHTFATHLIRRGADPHSAQRLLGHKNVSTTLHYYLHLTPEEVRAEWRAACPVRTNRS